MGHGEGGGDGMISVSSHILCVGRQVQVFPSGMGRKTEVVAACAAGSVSVGGGEYAGCLGTPPKRYGIF